MQMMYRSLTFTVACLTILSLDACHASKKSVSQKSSAPQFINGVYIDPHGAHATANTIDKNKKPAKPGKQTRASKTTTSRTTASKTAVTKPTIAPAANKISDSKQLKQKYAHILGVSPN